MIRVEFTSGLGDTLGLDKASDEVTLEITVANNETVHKLLDRLASKYPRFGQTIYDAGTARLMESVNLFLNGQHLELLSGLDTKLNDGDVLSLVPPITGG